MVERRLGVPEGFDYDKDPNCEYHPIQDFSSIQREEFYHRNKQLKLCVRALNKCIASSRLLRKQRFSIHCAA